MFGSSYRIATVWGIPIKLHMSLIVVTLFLVFQQGLAGGGPDAMLFRLLLSVGVFGSIALHELGHSFVALRLGCRVREITLMFMGGAAQMERIPHKPAGELTMALAGPAVSIVLGLTGFFVGRALIGMGLARVGVFLWLVGWINLFLAGFNLLPAFPMDGGRVLRAILTRKFGRLKATLIAARLGKILAVLFVLYALPAIGQRWVLAAIGIFIFTAAGREYRFVEMEETRRWGGGTAGPGPWAGGFVHVPFTAPPYEMPLADDDDEVEIGPPPYERGRTIRSDIEHDL